MNDVAIKVDGVSKKFCRSIKHTMLYGSSDLTKSFFGLNQRTEKRRKGEFWALDDVSFELKRGETLGIIGLNGSGKSTLLKLINGIFMPDKGKIEINGRVGALIEIGAGFHPMLTGRENVYINGAILGMGKKEIDKKFDEIVDFAGIGDFIDAPVKHYSSGMFVRLGFSIAVHAEPDILLVDEVLAVGDINFQIKCFRKITEFKEKEKTIILVTHDMGAIQRHTDRVVLLTRGEAVCEDIPKKIISKYLALVVGDFEETNIGQEGLKTMSVDELERAAQKGFLQENLEDDVCPQRENYNSNEFCYGSGGARIIDFEMLDTQGREITYLKSGDPILFRVKVMFYSSVQKPVFGVIVKTKKGVEIFSNNTLYKDIEVRPQKKGDILWVEHRIVLDLLPGDYFLSAGVAAIISDEVVPLDRRYDMVHLSVLPNDKSLEKVKLETDIKLYY